MPIEVITINTNVATIKYVLRASPISSHFCFKNVTAINLPTSRAEPITTMDTPDPTKSKVRPIMLKYAAHPAIAKADKRTKNAKNLI